MDNCHRAVLNPGYVETAFGRRRYFFPSDNKAKMKAQERESGNAPELVGGFKWGELMEPVDILEYSSGNHERSVRSNMHERAETRGQVHRDSNASTSALAYDNNRRYDIVRTVTNVDTGVAESLDKEPVLLTKLIQGTVGDALNIALLNLVNYRHTHGMKYKIILPVHDAIFIDAPVDEAMQVKKVVLPFCMRDAVPIPNTSLHLDVDTEMMRRWGEHISDEECLASALAEC